MNIRECIQKQTRNNENQKLQSKPTFHKVKQDLKSTRSPRSRGERPTAIDEDLSDSYKSKKMHAGEKKHYMEQQSSSDKFNNNFNGIISAVREVNGGRNTQSNEVIERRHRENQKKIAREKGTSNCSLNTKSTYSSETTSKSYKTAQQDSFKMSSLTNDGQQTSIVTNDSSLSRYKKNALIKGLLQNATNNYSDKGESSLECSSSDFLDASTSAIDIEPDMAKLSFISDESTMFMDRISRIFQANKFIQSQEDEDVFIHPIYQMKNDPEWRNNRLERKGTEVIHTPRDYYLNVDDDEFVFGS